MTFILAIQPKSRFAFLSLVKSTCPLGLLSLVSSIDKEYPKIIYNEEISGDLSAKNPDLFDDSKYILFSASIGNINRSIDLAKKVSKKGKIIVVGGPEVSMIGPRFLKDNPYFDAMVIGPGNDVIKELVVGKKKVYGPNIIWREQNLDCDPLEYTSPIKSLDFENARIDYGLLHDFDKYEGLSYFWGNDCAQAKDRCFFCGRLSMGIGYRPAEIVWPELLYAYRRGIRFFYNTTDSVSANVKKFAEFCNTKPLEMTDDEHRVFVNARDVNSELIEALRKLNGVAVIGFESFSNFSSVGKKNTDLITNFDALEKLFKSNIKMAISFVFGLPKETDDDVEKNEKGILDIVCKYGSFIQAIHLSPLLITTGSPAFKQMMAIPAIRKKYSSKSVPYDAIEMSDDYFKNFCHVTRDYCIERIFHLSGQVKKIAPHIKIGAKGITNEEEERYSKGLIINNANILNIA